ncbi:MAG: ferritin-like domain-containing protein [Leptothrix ochracea]|uniref:ferritin-like domain-containing protein n=1 Tax=Leptothrix ochracea TaxID=735331 RepID=UPI0034E22B2F
MELRQLALEALCLTDPTAKLAAVHGLWAQRQALPLVTAAIPVTPDRVSQIPGRPDRPQRIEPSKVPSRSPFTPEGRAALLHAIAHIEFNAINLALDAVWRFDDLPEAFYLDWLHVAEEEANHYSLLVEHMASMGYAYGDFDAHDGLWLMAMRTQDSVLARMALVPRTLEARGLDATPAIRAKLAQAGDARAGVILDLILREEIGHVAIGNRWYAWACEQAGITDHEAHYRELLHHHGAPWPRAMNHAARLEAGFTAEALSALTAVSAQRHNHALPRR